MLLIPPLSIECKLPSESFIDLIIHACNDRLERSDQRECLYIYFELLAYTKSGIDPRLAFKAVAVVLEFILTPCGSIARFSELIDDSYQEVLVKLKEELMKSSLRSAIVRKLRTLSRWQGRLADFNIAFPNMSSDEQNLMPRDDSILCQLFGMNECHIALVQNDIDVHEHAWEESVLDADILGWTPVSYAAMLNRNLFWKWAYVIKSTTLDIAKRTPLHHAVRADWSWLDDDETENLKRLNIDAIDRDSMSPLHWAAKVGNFDAVKNLLNSHALYDREDKFGRTPLRLAIDAGSLGCVEKLAEKYTRHKKLAPKDKQGRPLLHYACMSRTDNEDIVSVLLNNNLGLTASDVDEKGMTPLHYAAKADAVKIMSILISKGADIKSRANNYTTPLHFAASSNALRAAKLLTRSRGSKEQSNLHFQPVSGDASQAARVIFKRHFNTEVRSDDGLTPLLVASGYESYDVAEYVIQKGADKEAQTNLGDRSIHIAARTGSVKVAMILLKAGVAVDSQCSDGTAPLQIAVMRNLIPMTRLFLD